MTDKLLATARLILILGGSAIWIVLVSMMPFTKTVVAQFIIATMATAFLTLDEGIRKTIGVIHEFIPFVSMIGVLTGTFVLLHLSTLDAFYALPFFYSTMIGLRWFVRRINMRDVLAALPPGRARLVVAVLRALFSTAGADVHRIMWYCEVYERGISGPKFYGARSKGATILGSFLWLRKDVPVKVALLENRHRHLGTNV